MGSECCFSKVSWFSHSAAINVAARGLVVGINRGFPEGVLRGLLSNVTARASPRLSTPTVFQNRFKVASAPIARVHRLLTRLPREDLRFVAVTAGPGAVATVA